MMRRNRTSEDHGIDEKIVANRNSNQKVYKASLRRNEAEKEAERRKPLGLMDEKIMETVLISNMEQLQEFVKTLDSIEQVGCYLDLTRKLGRFDRCAHIILNVSDMLIVINIMAFQSTSKCEEELWKTMGKHLLSNEKIEKIFFDSSHTADYLYHKHGIRLANTVDLKVARECLLKKELACWCACEAQEITKKKANGELDRLVDFWEVYIPSECRLLEYAIMLREEPRGFQLRPTEKKRLALQVKYLVKIYEVMKKIVMCKLEDMLDVKLAIDKC